MIARVIPLRGDARAAYLEAYLVKNSPEFQTDKKRPLVIICPGGAHMGTSDREAEPLALRLLAQGYHAFVLRYSVRTRFPDPVVDLAKAILTVRENAEEWLVDPDHIAVCGFSAGGHLAASIGVFWDKPFIYEALGTSGERIKPNALLLSYPLINLELIGKRPIVLDSGEELVVDNEGMFSMILGEPHPAQELKDRYSVDLHVSSATPPTFIWHTADDEIVSSHNALRFAAALARHNVPYELHIFESGIHGLSLGDETSDEQQQFVNPHCRIWIDLALRWLRRREKGFE